VGGKTWSGVLHSSWNLWTGLGCCRSFRAVVVAVLRRQGELSAPQCQHLTHVALCGSQAKRLGAPVGPRQACSVARKRGGRCHSTQPGSRGTWFRIDNDVNWCDFLHPRHLPGPGATVTVAVTVAVTAAVAVTCCCYCYCCCYCCCCCCCCHGCAVRDAVIFQCRWTQWSRWRRWRGTSCGGGSTGTKRGRCVVQGSLGGIGGSPAARLLWCSRA